MKVTTEDITEAFITWVETDLVPRSNLLQQGIITFLVLQGKHKLVDFIGLLNYLSDDSLFDLSELSDNLRKSLDKMGGHYVLPMIDYKLDKEDLDKILEILNERAKRL